jgi:hypothetical protein
MSAPIRRNAVVKLLGTPDRTEGSLNDPRRRREYGLDFNEKWIYEHLTDDPAGVPIRVVLWNRYDFAATLVRSNESQPWKPDKTLEAVLSKDSGRMPALDAARHQPLRPTAPYRPASEFKGQIDLGGRIQGK